MNQSEAQCDHKNKRNVTRPPQSAWRPKCCTFSDSWYFDLSLALKQNGARMLVDNDIKDITTGYDAREVTQTARSADLPGTQEPQLSDTHHAGHCFSRHYVRSPLHCETNFKSDSKSAEIFWVPASSLHQHGGLSVILTLRGCSGVCKENTQQNSKLVNFFEIRHVNDKVNMMKLSTVDTHRALTSWSNGTKVEMKWCSISGNQRAKCCVFNSPNMMLPRIFSVFL